MNVYYVQPRDGKYCNIFSKTGYSLKEKNG